MKNKWEEKWKDRLKTILGGYCWYMDGGNGGYDFDDVLEHIQQALANERKRIADEVKRAVIESTYIGGVTDGDELAIKINNIINKEE